MKNLIKILFILIPLLSSAQNVEDFAKIHIPTAFSDFDENQYQMNQYLRLMLKQKGYEVFSGNEKRGDLLYDPCEMLFADIKDESSWFRTKLKIEFRDCRDVVVAKYEGNTQEKDLKKGHIEAVKDALSNIGVYNGKAYSVKYGTEKPQPETIEKPKKSFTEKIVDGVKEATDVVVEEVKEITQKKTTDISDGSVYTDGFRDYDLSKEGKTISLIDLSLNSVFATLYPTRNDEIYQVKFADESSAVGYLYPDKIILEKYNDKGEKQELILKKK